MEPPNPDQLSDISDKLHHVSLTSENESEHGNENDGEYDYDDDEEDEDEEGDFEFSFVGGELGSPVSAEEVFQDGQIRPVYPFFGQSRDEASYGPPVRKVFVVENDDVAEGPYCVWTSSEKSPEETPASAPAPEMSRKSNSTGFSKFWRVKDLLVRSNSDGKDAFVFLNGKEATAVAGAGSSSVEKKKKVVVEKIDVRSKGETAVAGEKKKGKKKAVSASTEAYEALYGKKEKRKGGGKSYLPYRQDLVGFFTNVNGMTRNVHPY